MLDARCFIDYRLVFDPDADCYWLCYRGERIALPDDLNGDLSRFVERAFALDQAFKTMNAACEAVDG